MKYLLLMVVLFMGGCAGYPYSDVYYYGGCRQGYSTGLGAIEQYGVDAPALKLPYEREVIVIDGGY